MHHRSFPDPGVRRQETVPRKKIEVRIFLEPGFQVLGPHEVVRVVVHGTAIFPVEPCLHLVDREQGIRLPFPLRHKEAGKSILYRPGSQERVRGMGHEINVGGNVLNVVRDDQVHADEIAADLRPAVADQHPLGILQAVLRQDLPGIGIDHHQIDLGDRQERIEYPAEQRFSGQGAEILALDALAVRLHGQKGHERVTSA